MLRGRRREQRLRRGGCPRRGRRHGADGSAHHRGRRGRDLDDSDERVSGETPPASRSTSGPGSGSSAGGSGSPSSAVSGATRSSSSSVSPLDEYIDLIYLCAVYGNRGHACHSRPALDRPPVRLRDQGHRRPARRASSGPRATARSTRSCVGSRAEGLIARRGVSQRRPVADACTASPLRDAKTSRRGSHGSGDDGRAPRRVAAAALLRGCDPTGVRR